jgi:TolB-like protein/tetratricopeptide (TPR) repeat protein
MRTPLYAAIVLIAGSVPAAAQCSDGSPPPCRTATVASTRRPDPKLDDRTWIVVPFDNLNGNQEIDWLRSGSVNLLYMSMSRWTDMRVIDDERVADYMREVPGTTDSKQLSLAQGLAVAKRAGAGRLVMGDLLKLGSRTTVNAKIFDVKTGQRVRTVREETAIADSLMPMFGKLSQKVLNIAPPAGSAVGVVGTSSVGAYQAYAQGMQALNKFELELAEGHFKKALELDSTFALAHSKLAVLLGWVTPGSPVIRQHSEAAGRLSGTLPPREKALIDASVAFSRNDYLRACDGFRALVKKDSTDTDAWYGLGDCLYHDLAIELVPGDSTRVRWRADRSASLRAFKTVLALDPTYHLAYQHLVDGYLAPTIGGRYCPTPQTCAAYTTVLRPSGDSILTVPLQLPRDSATYRAHMQEYMRNGLRKTGIETALSTANAWLDANPTEGRAQIMKAAVLLSFGRTAEAQAIMDRAGAGDRSNGGINTLLTREELLIKLWRGTAALQLYDSLRTSSSQYIGGTNAITFGNMMATISPVFGQMTLFDSLVAIGNRGAPASRANLSRQLLRVMAGVPTDSFVAAFNGVFNEVAGAGMLAPITRQLGQYVTLTARTFPDAQWPKLDTTVTEPKAMPAIAKQRGDTAGMRRAARALDSISAVFASGLVPDSGFALFAAEAYLAVRDSAAALNMARRWLDTTLQFTPLLVNQQGSSPQVLVPRAMLLRADLAAGLGRRDEARTWYGNLLGFLAKADPQSQPLIDRVRKAYAAVGGT